MNGFAALARMRAQLKRLPDVQEAVAKKAAPGLTSQLQASFAAGQTVYGEPRPVGSHGNTVTLMKSGALAGNLKFTAAGTKLRCNLGTPYARFLIKFGILPRGGQPIPTQWGAEIKRHAEQELAARTRGL